MCASGLSLLFCLVLVRIYFENSVSKLYIATRGSKCRTANCAVSGYSLLSRDQISKRVAGWKVSSCFLSILFDFCV
jgi:hypothetical protein